MKKSEMVNYILGWLLIIVNFVFYASSEASYVNWSLLVVSSVVIGKTWRVF